jgi:hypothetical protein
VEDRKHSGRPSTFTTPEMIAKLREVILEDWRQTIHDVCNRVGLSYGSTHSSEWAEHDMNCSKGFSSSFEQWTSRPSGSGVHRAAKSS